MARDLAEELCGGHYGRCVRCCICSFVPALCPVMRCMLALANVPGNTGVDAAQTLPGCTRPVHDDVLPSRHIVLPTGNCASGVQLPTASQRRRLDCVLKSLLVFAKQSLTVSTRVEIPFRCWVHAEAAPLRCYSTMQQPSTAHFTSSTWRK